MTPPKAFTDSARFAHFESKVESIGDILDTFVAESKEYRQRQDRTEAQIWSAIREQGERMNSAVEKLSNNGRISWGMIVSTGGFLLTLIATGAAVNNALSEARVKQLEIRAEYHQRELDRSYTERKVQDAAAALHAAAFRAAAETK